MSQITEDIKKSLSVLSELKYVDILNNDIAPGGASVDWKARPEIVLEEVSQLLEYFNLEVVIYDSLDDSLHFDIVKKDMNIKPQQLPAD